MLIIILKADLQRLDERSLSITNRNHGTINAANTQQTKRLPNLHGV